MLHPKKPLYSYLPVLGSVHKNSHTPADATGTVSGRRSAVSSSQVPCILIGEVLGFQEKAELQQNHMVSGDKSEATADCSATQPACSLFLSVATADTPAVGHFHLADSSYCLIMRQLPGFHLSTPVSVFTQNADHEMRCLNPNSHFTFPAESLFPLRIII